MGGTTNGAAPPDAPTRPRDHEQLRTGYALPRVRDQDHPGGGVNRCEATGPMAPLPGSTVRALVLKADNPAQLSIDSTSRP